MTDKPREYRLSHQRSRWDNVSDLLLLVGMVAFIAAVMGEVPPLIGYGLFAIALAASMLTDPLTQFVLIIPVVYVYVGFQKVAGRLRE